LVTDWGSAGRKADVAIRGGAPVCSTPFGIKDQIASRGVVDLDIN